MQHRFTRMITSLKSLQYEARLQKLGLWILEERRNRADLIEVFKMAHGFSAIPLTDMFQIDTIKRTRGIHWSWFNVFSALIEWCPSGICWIMILWWQRQLMVSRLTGMGKEDESVFGLMSAGPRGRNEIPERPSCKYFFWAQCMIGSSSRAKKLAQLFIHPFSTEHWFVTGTDTSLAWCTIDCRVWTTTSNTVVTFKFYYQ